MKKKTKKKLLLFIIISLIFILAFSLTRKDNTKLEENKKPSPEENNKVTENIKQPDKVGTNYLNEIKYTVNLDKEVEKVIVEFFNVYYNSMKELRENDMTYLFLNPSSDDALINQTAVSLLVETRKNKPNDLKLDKVKYDLNIKEVTKNGDDVKVKLLENNYLNFNFMKEIESKIYDIENEFVLRKVNDIYKIVKYDKVQDFYVMLTDKYTSGGIDKINSIKEDYLKIFKKNIEEDKMDYNNYLNDKDKPYKKVDHEFDRIKAKEATVWVNKRNPKWHTYESNCQTFASYVLKTGGIPNDYLGDKNTIWADDKINEGYYSWTYVPTFRQYAKTNTGSGLSATVDANIYYADTGDVIHVGTSGPTRHALVVKEPFYKDGKVIDILVNSNTIDLENFPISAYSYPYVSLIKIHGWNE